MEGGEGGREEDDPRPWQCANNLFNHMNAIQCHTTYHIINIVIMNIHSSVIGMYICTCL